MLDSVTVDSSSICFTTSTTLIQLIHRLNQACSKPSNRKCPPQVVELANITKDPKVSMCQVASTPFTLDNSFYLGLLNKKAFLKLDQELAFTDLTSRLAAQYANNPKFFQGQFSESMIKLGNVSVLTGQQGEIRLNCRRVNGDTSNKLRN